MRTVKNLIDMADIELDKKLEELHQKYAGDKLTTDELYTAIDTLWHHITDLIEKVEELHTKKDHE